MLLSTSTGEGLGDIDAKQGIFQDYAIFIVSIYYVAISVNQNQFNASLY